MSLHPLSTEMLLAEGSFATAATAGGVALWRHEHPALAVGAWALAGLVVAGALATARLERADYPPRVLLPRVATALLGSAWLAGLGWGAWRLHRAGRDGLAALLVIAGLWGAPLAVLALASLVPKRRRDRTRGA